MPSETRWIDEADDKALPDDLAALAEQLRDDARWLSERYRPAATSVAPTRPARAHVWRHRMMVTSAAVVLLAAGLFSIQALWIGGSGPVATFDDPLAGIPPGPGSLLMPNSDISMAPGTQVMGFEELGFEDLSAAQQEAVLDLWEGRPSESHSLSI